MNTTFTEKITLIKKTCLSCSGVFAINEDWYERRCKDGGCWRCPYCGTSWFRTETDNIRLERELKEAEKKLASERARHDQTKASLSAQKAVTTRLKNRIKNGVCPCCHRHFKNLHAHMKNQHPDYQ